MASLPRLTKSQIRHWTDARSFSKGERYYQSGRILNPHIQGNTLKAQCRGSRPTPYRVEITLDAQGILSGHCSCPVGTGGHCKHAVALLLTWLHAPERFTEVEPVDTALEQRSKEELIALIQRMLQLYPDLESLLTLPLPGAGQVAAPVDPAAIRHQLQGILGALSGEGYYDWHELENISTQLSFLVETGDAYAQAGEWESAVTVYDMVMRAILEVYPDLHDSDGIIAMVVDECAAGLGRCLAQVTDQALREKTLASLFRVYCFDVEIGDRGIGAETVDILLEQTTPEERQRVAGWVEEAIQEAGRSKDKYWSQWRRQTFGGFLLALQGDQMDDEAFLALCRRTERHGDLVAKLLELGRVEEAREVAQAASDYALMGLADIFWAQGHRELAEELVRERLPQTQDMRLLAWLAQRAEERQDLAQALKYQEEIFFRRPSLEGYRRIRELAQRLDAWEDVAPELLSRLVRTNNFAVLTRIFLEEGEVEQAIEALAYLRKHQRYGYGWDGGSLDLQVAEAAEKEFPQEAIRIYLAQAEELIAARGRQNYAAAARYLSRIRDLYRRLGQEDAWQALITRIREENKTLRALKDELQKANL